VLCLSVTFIFLQYYPVCVTAAFTGTRSDKGLIALAVLETPNKTYSIYALIDYLYSSRLDPDFWHLLTSGRIR